MLYIGFYRFSKFMKGIGSNYLFVRPHVDAIFLITAFELLNVATIWLFFSLNSLTGSFDLDMAIAAFLIFGLNGLSKLRNQRYKKIILKYEVKKKFDLVLNAAVILYMLGSILSFCFVQSNQWRFTFDRVHLLLPGAGL